MKKNSVERVEELEKEVRMEELEKKQNKFTFTLFDLMLLMCVLGPLIVLFVVK